MIPVNLLGRPSKYLIPKIKNWRWFHTCIQSRFMLVIILCAVCITPLSLPPGKPTKRICKWKLSIKLTLIFHSKNFIPRQSERNFIFWVDTSVRERVMKLFRNNEKPNPVSFNFTMSHCLRETLCRKND